MCDHWLVDTVVKGLLDFVQTTVPLSSCRVQPSSKGLTGRERLSALPWHTELGKDAEFNKSPSRAPCTCALRAGAF